MRRRRLASALVAVLTLTGLAACGDESSGGGPASEGIDGLTITGEFGEAPEVEVDGVEVDEPETATIIEGDGEELTAEGAASTRILIAKAADGSELASSYEDPEPYNMVVSEQPPIIADAVTGATIGSRVALALPANELYGAEGNPQMGVAADDDIVVVFDLLEAAEPPAQAAECKGTARLTESTSPTIVEKKGDVTGLDFEGAPENPPCNLQVITLSEGDGKPVKEDDQVTVDYYGSVWGGEEAFDSSFERGEPATFPLSKGSLIDGWVQGLQGVNVGSRVMMVIPPDLGYGDQGQEAIPAGSTLVFVIDVLKAGS
jgi:peptidylprolyl isomerase